MFIGTSGYQYGHWNEGVFYPIGTRNQLSFYLTKFNSLEINNSFYRIPSPDTVSKWSDKVPDNFGLVLKVPKHLTHMYRLKLHSESTTISQGIDILNYFITGVKMISADKLGPMLLQLHPKANKNLERLNDVLAIFQAANIQVAVEIRNNSWYTDDTFELIKNHNCSLASTDWLTCKTSIIDTSDFVYIRRHGYNERYTNSYPDELLIADVEVIKHFEQLGKRVYIFFNNDGCGYAPQNALRLKELYDRFSS